MIDEETSKEIMEFIKKWPKLIEYGKLQVTLNIVAEQVVDAECLPIPRKRFSK